MERGGDGWETPPRERQNVTGGQRPVAMYRHGRFVRLSLSIVKTFHRFRLFFKLFRFFVTQYLTNYSDFAIL